jgi:hypothetical protein
MEELHPIIAGVHPPHYRPMVRLAISAGAIGLTHLGEIYPVWVMHSGR